MHRQSLDTQAIVLRRQKSGETSLDLLLLTHSAGKVHASARGAFRHGSHLAGALDLFFHIEVSATRGGRGSRYYIRDAKPLNLHPGIRRDLGRMQAACYFGELLDLVLPTLHPSPEAYDLLLRALAFLDQNTPRLDHITLFEHRVLELMGLGNTRMPQAEADIAFQTHFGAYPTSRKRWITG